MWQQLRHCGCRASRCAAGLLRDQGGEAHYSRDRRACVCSACLMCLGAGVSCVAVGNKAVGICVALGLIDERCDVR